MKMGRVRILQREPTSRADVRPGEIGKATIGDPMLGLTTGSDLPAALKPGVVVS